MSGRLSVGGVHPSGKANFKNAVEFDLTGALQVTREMDGLTDQIRWMQKRAMQTLRRRLYTQARRDIQTEFNIKAGRVTKDLRTNVVGDLVTVTGYFRGIGLSNFGARQTRKGVTYTFYHGRGRTLAPGAFMAPLLSGNRHAVIRYGAKREMTRGSYVGQLRQPLSTEYGPTVAQMLASKGRPERLADYAAGVLRDEMQRIFNVRYGRKPPTTTG